MTQEQIEAHHKELARLNERLAEVRLAACRYPTSRDIAFLERELEKQWNRLVTELSDAGVEHEYELRTVIEAQPPKIPWTLELFLQRVVDRSDTMPEKKKPTSKFSDGLSWIVGD
jgi:hypothetical protein